MNKINLSTQTQGVLPYVNQPVGVTQPGMNFVAEGDSLSTGYGLTTPATQSWPAQFATLPIAVGRLAVSTVAVNGSTLAQMASRYTANVHPLSPAVTGKPGILSLTMLGNDYALLATEGFAQYRTDFNTYLTTARTDGWKVLVHTQYDQYGRRGSDNFRLQFNDFIRSNGNIDYVVDPSRRLSNSQDTTLFQSDNTHPTVEGSREVALMVQAAFWSGGISDAFGKSVLENSGLGHRIQADYAGNDLLTIRNTNNGTGATNSGGGYSTLRFEDYSGTPQLTFGYSNPGAGFNSGSTYQYVQNNKIFLSYQNGSEAYRLTGGQFQPTNGINAGNNSATWDFYNNSGASAFMGFRAGSGWTAQHYMPDQSGASVTVGVLASDHSTFSPRFKASRDGGVTVYGTSGQTNNMEQWLTSGNTTPVAGQVFIAADGTLQTKDTTNGHTYKLQMVSGVLTPTQVS